MSGRTTAPSGALLSALLLAAPAHAAGFDPATNLVDLEGAALAIDFESVGRVPVTVYDAHTTPVEAVIADDGANAIQGRRSLRITGATPLVSIDLDPVREGLLDRRIEIRLWQRPLGTRLTGDLRWSNGDLDLGALTIQPTGAVTIDGWEEWTTGPVDFALGELTPRRLVLYDDQYFSSFAFHEDLGVALDAVTVLDLGPALVPRTACRLTTERTDCGPLGTCAFGRCADAAAVLGAPLYDPALRADALARRAFEVRAFEGGRRARDASGAFVARLARLADPDVTTARDYWTGLRAAYDALGDGHAAAPLAGPTRAVRGGACAYYAEADLLPGAPVALMVYEPTRGHALGELLRTGDVVRAIDGLSPEAWSTRAARLFDHPGDPASRLIAIAPAILGVALATGARLDIDRCAGPDPCTAAQVQHLTVDLAPLAAARLAAGDVDALTRSGGCDFRFHRPVREDRGGRDVEYAGFADTEGVREIQLNAVPGSSRWQSTIDRALDAPYPRILIDQRLGTSGTASSLELLVSRLLAPQDLVRAELWPPLGVEPSAALRDALAACAATSGTSCAGFIGLDFEPGHRRRGIAATARLAILDGYDIAGNELVAAALARRTRGLTRIFGPGPTMGAFGPGLALTRLPGDVSGPSLHSHDTVFLAPGEAHFEFTTGSGLAPHVLVLQRQSDALRGVDTVLEAARAWVRAE